MSRIGRRTGEQDMPEDRLLSFGLYLVGAQALSRLDVEREPQQLAPHHVQRHNALCKDPQDGVVGVDTVENCKRKNNILKSFEEIHQCA